MSKATQTDAMGSIQRGIKRTLDFVMFSHIYNYFCVDEVSREWSYILSSNTHWI